MALFWMEDPLRPGAVGAAVVPASGWETLAALLTDHPPAGAWVPRRAR
jgi:hypothetical protein